MARSAGSKQSSGVPKGELPGGLRVKGADGRVSQISKLTQLMGHFLGNALTDYGCHTPYYNMRWWKIQSKGLLSL